MATHQLDPRILVGILHVHSVGILKINMVRPYTWKVQVIDYLLFGVKEWVPTSIFPLAFILNVDSKGDDWGTDWPLRLAHAVLVVCTLTRPPELAQDNAPCHQRLVFEKLTPWSRSSFSPGARVCNCLLIELVISEATQLEMYSHGEILSTPENIWTAQGDSLNITEVLTFLNIILGNKKEHHQVGNKSQGTVVMHTHNGTLQVFTNPPFAYKNSSLTVCCMCGAMSKNQEVLCKPTDEEQSDCVLRILFTSSYLGTISLTRAALNILSSIFLVARHMDHLNDGEGIKYMEMTEPRNNADYQSVPSVSAQLKCEGTELHLDHILNLEIWALQVTHHLVKAGWQNLWLQHHVGGFSPWDPGDMRFVNNLGVIVELQVPWDPGLQFVIGGGSSWSRRFSRGDKCHEIWRRPTTVMSLLLLSFVVAKAKYLESYA